MKAILLFTFLAVTLQDKCGHQGNASTNNSAHQDNMETLQKLYAKYKNGEIQACKYNGATVYKGGLNAADAGHAVFDFNGVKIASCNYGWGKADTICKQLSDCEDVYRAANNIWDKPAVDKYNLAR